MFMKLCQIFRNEGNVDEIFSVRHMGLIEALN
jgi:hypothetical protein